MPINKHISSQILISQFLSCALIYVPPLRSWSQLIPSWYQKLEHSSVLLLNIWLFNYSCHPSTLLLQFLMLTFFFLPLLGCNLFNVPSSHSHPSFLTSTPPTPTHTLMFNSNCSVLMVISAYTLNPLVPLLLYHTQVAKLYIRSNCLLHA